MSELGYFERLAQNMKDHGSYLCIGLDPQLELIESFNFGSTITIDEAGVQFLKNVILNTKDYACAFKINRKFYSKFINPDEVIRQLVTYIRSFNTGEKEIQIIYDAKEGDVKHSLNESITDIQNKFKFDAITINPYLGFDSFSGLSTLFPKTGFYILILTSNPQTISLQRDFSLISSDLNAPLYYSLADQIKNIPNFGGVFGATNISELRTFCNVYPNLHLLNPGVGVQGGSIEDTIKITRNRGLVSASRSIVDQRSKPELVDINKGGEYNQAYFDLVELAAKNANNLISEAKI